MNHPIPVLPDELAELLDDASPAEDSATDEQVAAFVVQHQSASRPHIINGWQTALTRKIETGASRHNSAISVVTGALNEARCGYFAAADAVNILKPIFINAVRVDNSRTDRQAENEWKDITAWAVGQANAADLDDVRARVDEKMPDHVEWVEQINGHDPYADVPLPDEPPDDSDQPDDDSADIKHSGHLGMAVKLAKQFHDKLLHVYRIGWHRWDGRRWAPDSDGAARRAVHKVIKRDRAVIEKLELPAEEEEKRLKQIARYETAPAISGILTEAAALKAFAAATDAFDADPWLLNCANGTLDLRTLQLRSHDPADRITKVCRGAHRGDAAAPAWEAFLARVLPDEDVRAFVQRLAGLALLGETREHILAIFTGVGANGKGTLYKAVLHTLGDYACPAEPNLFTSHDGAHPAGQMDLLGRRLVIVSESGEGRQLDAATMKRLTGGDPIKARYMRENFVTFTPSHLAIMVTNYLPKVSGDDPAVWRRIRVVPFNVVIPDEQQDKTLDAKLQLEADGILSWAIDGWRDYLEHGLAEPDSVRVATDDYKRRNDAVGRFITDRCHISPLMKATTKDLYAAWCRWQEADGRCEPMGRGAFGEALDRRGYPAANPVHGKRWRQGIAVKTGQEFADEN